MINAQQKYLTKQQVFTKAKVKLIKLVLIKMPTNTWLHKLAKVR